MRAAQTFLALGACAGAALCACTDTGPDTPAATRDATAAWEAPIVVGEAEGMVTRTIETSQYVYLPAGAPELRAYDVEPWIGEPTFAVYHWDWEAQLWHLGEAAGGVPDYGGPAILGVVTDAPVTVAIGYLAPLVALDGCLWLDDQGQDEGDGDGDGGADDPPAGGSGETPDPDPGFDEDFGLRCGSISTVMSLLKLKWIKESAVKDGTKFKPAALTQFDKLVKEGGMATDDLGTAHGTYLPKNHVLREESHNGVTAESTAAQWDAFWTGLKQLNDDGWDCILSMHGSIHHAEQIRTITLSSDGKKATVATNDAAKQGGLFGANADYPPAKNTLDLAQNPKFGGVDGTQIIPGGNLSKTKDRTIDSVSFNCFNSEPAPQ